MVPVGLHGRAVLLAAHKAGGEPRGTAQGDEQHGLIAPGTAAPGQGLGRGAGGVGGADLAGNALLDPAVRAIQEDQRRDRDAVASRRRVRAAHP